MNDLTTLMRAETTQAPAQPDDLGDILSRGRARVRRRRLAAGGAVLTTGLVVAGLTTVVPVSLPTAQQAIGPATTSLPAAAGPRIELTGALDAAPGTHYDVLASQRNDDLDSDNGTYLRGVTDDGLTLLQDGPRIGTDKVRWGLRSGVGEVQWLPSHLGHSDEVRPLELSRDRLVLARVAGAHDGRTTSSVEVFDRTSGTWSSHQLGAARADITQMKVGPDGRLWFTAGFLPGDVPRGGWPNDLDSRADDSGADGETYRLLSVDLADSGSEPRVEVPSMGSYGFGDQALVWTDATNGRPGQVHVRDLGVGRTRTFDPGTGQQCNLLDLSVAGDRIALNQYCGTVLGARDDRVQVVSTGGEQVGTYQGTGFEGQLVGTDGRHLVLEPDDPDTFGTYLVDLDSEDRSTFRLAQGLSGFPTPGIVVPGDALSFSQPVNDSHGEKTTVIRWRD